MYGNCNGMKLRTSEVLCLNNFDGFPIKKGVKATGIIVPCQTKWTKLLVWLGIHSTSLENDAKVFFNETLETQTLQFLENIEEFSMAIEEKGMIELFQSF